MTANTNTAIARTAAERAADRAAEALRIKRVFDESAKTVGAAFEALAGYPALSFALVHLENASQLYAIGAETLDDFKDLTKSSEHLVCGALAEIELYNAAIAAADAVEAGEIRAEDAPWQFFRVLEKISFVTYDDDGNPEGGLSDSAQARQWLYEGHLMGYGAAFDRDGAPVASYFEVRDVRFERCFGAAVTAYIRGVPRAVWGLAAQVAGDLLDSIEELETL